MADSMVMNREGYERVVATYRKKWGMVEVCVCGVDGRIVSFGGRPISLWLLLHPSPQKPQLHRGNNRPSLGFGGYAWSHNNGLASLD